MKKTLAWLVVLLGLGLYLGSSHVGLMDAIQDFRDQHPALKHRRYLNGDLYGFSLLRKYKQPQTYELETKSRTKGKPVRLFVFCDSYLDKRIKPSNFSQVDSIAFMRYWNNSTYLHHTKLDTSHKNVVVLEMSERHVRGLLNGGIGGLQEMLVLDQNTGTTIPIAEAEPETNTWKSLEKNYFNPNINSNLEINLFEYAPFEPFKELKAWINYKWFNRYNKIVFVDEEKDHLYYAPTLSADSDEGAFKPLHNTEVDSQVSRLNAIRQHYLNQGFDAVYLSIIPNPVSCIHPDLGDYNHLVERVYYHPSLAFPLINVWPEFSKQPKTYFHPGDSHWNKVGLQFWVNRLDSVLVY